VDLDGAAAILLTMTENADALLRTREVAYRLDLAPETVRRMAQDGRLASLRLPSGEYRFRRLGELE